MVEPVFENAAEIIEKFIVDMTRYFQLSILPCRVLALWRRWQLIAKRRNTQLFLRLQAPSFRHRYRSLIETLKRHSEVKGERKGKSIMNFSKSLK